MPYATWETVLREVNESIDNRSWLRGSSAPLSKPISTVRGVEYDMEPFIEQCVEKYLELAGKTKAELKNAPTPCVDDSYLKEEDHAVKGALAPVAAKIVMKILYVARVCRNDLLLAVNALARTV